MTILNTPLNDLPIVVFDTETTGLFTMSAWLVEIAGVRMTGNFITTIVFQSLVRPGDKIPPDATAVHHITDDDVRGAPPPRKVLRAFLNWALRGKMFRSVEDIVSEMGYEPPNKELDDSFRPYEKYPCSLPIGPCDVQFGLIRNNFGDDWQCAYDLPSGEIVIENAPIHPCFTPPKFSRNVYITRYGEVKRPVECEAAFAAHNAPFDLGILATAFRRAAIKPPKDFVCIDTCAWARRVLELPSYSLSVIADLIASRNYVDITFSNHMDSDRLGMDAYLTIGAARFAMTGFHRALGDSFHTATVLSYLMANTIRPGEEMTLGELKELIPGAVIEGFPEQSSDVTLPSHLSAVKEALATGKDVLITYAGGTANVPKRRIRPIGFYSVKGTAYLEAFCCLDGFVKTFRVDRIRSASAK